MTTTGAHMVADFIRPHSAGGVINAPRATIDSIVTFIGHYGSHMKLQRYFNKINGEHLLD